MLTPRDDARLRALVAVTALVAIVLLLPGLAQWAACSLLPVAAGAHVVGHRQPSPRPPAGNRFQEGSSSELSP